MDPAENLPVYSARQEGHLVSTDKDLLQIDVVHDYLANQSYWAQGVSRVKVEQAIAFSLCFGVYDEEGAQVGFARVISDYTTFAYLSDAFILPPRQGCGLGKWLLSCILAHPHLQGLRRWTLYTRDAHELYKQFGFEEEPEPWKHMVMRPQLRAAMNKGSEE
jgi:GNAT superfamily N-acetyltransferase